MPTRALAAVLALTLAAACADAEKERLKQTTRPTYDPATGRLAELTYDANRNGQVDTWMSMDGSRPLGARIDRNEDGRIDRWEYYDEKGTLLKVGFSRKDAGTPDGWAYAGPDGQVQRIEFSSTGSQSQIDRWEHYRSAPGARGSPPATDVGASPVLTLVEVDQDGNGRVDQWETYEDGTLRTAAYDVNGDGAPDRRLTYARSTLVLIESDPDGAGGFASRRAIN
jgi:hypothetical protein